MSRSRSLASVTLILVALLVLHDLDHVRQGRSLPGPVIVVGIFGLITALAALVLTLLSHPLASLAVLLVGVGNVVGFTAVHVLPHWSLISDSYQDASIDTISWFSVGVTIVVAAGLTIVAFKSMRAKTSVS